MIETIQRAWKVKEIRQRILFSVFVLIIYRMGSAISVPFIDTNALKTLISENSMLGLLNLISGDNFSKFSIFAMGISPYINASIIMQLLTMAIPSLERLAKDGGEEGKAKINRYTRFVALGMSVLMAYGLTASITQIMTEAGSANSLNRLLILINICAGTSLLLWLGEQITEKGIGNGSSLIIFFSIISGIPSGLIGMFSSVSQGALALYKAVAILVFIFISVFAVILIHEGTRKIPVQYAKRVVGRKQYGGRNTNLPLKVNQAGVIPIIFAQTFALFPQQVAQLFFPNTAAAKWITANLALTKPWVAIIYVLMIIGFEFFYTTMTFNPPEVAENLRQYGGVIPGIRQGKATEQYLTRILNRITLAGGVFSSMVAVVPIFISALSGSSNMQFAGTSVLIVVGVALETVQQLEQLMTMRNYKGFLK